MFETVEEKVEERVEERGRRECVEERVEDKCEWEAADSHRISFVVVVAVVAVVAVVIVTACCSRLAAIVGYSSFFRLILSDKPLSLRWPRILRCSYTDVRKFKRSLH